ncbi:integral membrane protein [Grosmannia clavigera kw1407]|uniref:Integral membrane protein n=1 Tax=Grosmannia clavigera (strain kw1407 / UAMH 11150) TaxID=655863 RepID=F0XG52_GROCL|nr:uncharacterized protein CMQ_5462 [Grosmannia clavigera kw1407]EFX03412.1 integral membrane protein [Grosmannia clavigera kw1407]
MSTATPPDPLPRDINVSPVLISISAVLIFLVFLTTTVRIWVRLAMRRMGRDDYTMIAAAIICISRFFIQVAQAKSGNGRHRWYISHDKYVHNNMLGWVAQLHLFAGVCVLKCSILFLVLRIKDSKKLKHIIWAIMTGLVVTNLGCIIILLAECTPVSAYWAGNGVCWDAKVRIYAIYFTIDVYAITAIWSNLELFLGVIAANLAVSRQIYAYFFGDGNGNLANSSYYNNSGFQTGPKGSRLQDNANTNNSQAANTIRRHPSAARSDHSDVPLEWGIRKRTDFWMTEQGVDSASTKDRPTSPAS